MKRLVKEPLLHFLLLGAAIFAAYRLQSRPVEPDPPGRIVVTGGQVESLAAGFAKAWSRPPSDGELKGLIDDWVREEIAVRESIAMGLEKDDGVIRRRLRQKIEFISEDTSARAEATDADLDAYLRSHADAFRVEQQVTFRHVYLSPGRRGPAVTGDAAQMLTQLNRAGEHADVAALGDPSLLPRELAAMSTSEVASQFGKPFAAQLGDVKVGQWQGPIESGYGLHLVFVSERTAGRLPALPEVRDAVHREWINARRAEAAEKFYNDLLGRYVVTIEPPAPAAPTKVAAGGAK